MIQNRNKHFFLLLFVVSLCTAVQGMGQHIIPLTMQALQQKKSELLDLFSKEAKKVGKEKTEGTNFLLDEAIALYWASFKKKIEGADCIAVLHKMHCGCSYMGLTIIDFDLLTTDFNKKTNFRPYAIKKEEVNQYRFHGVIPTPLDKQFALLEKWKQYPATIKKICLFYNCCNSVLLTELRDYIGQLTFDLEESLL
ncbi:MAG TPA: hypothetical protein VLB80_02145 [Candidatus Babeliales bacterium]|nr:hypothetical protein [Candidatus Babeliales bacterium]